MYTMEIYHNATFWRNIDLQSLLFVPSIFINSLSDLFLLALLVFNNNFLQDILENDDIQLDLMFIASIVFDIIRVSYWALSIIKFQILNA